MACTNPHNKTRVSLVIPGRNCAATIRQCLDAVFVIARQPDSPLCEILFVNDNSDDDTPEIVASYESVRMLNGPGRGPATARNIGWRAAKHPLIWFIDSDCVAHADALDQLLSHLADKDVGGVSGSYDIENDHSLLARLIHEEILERHRNMNSDVNFAASFNVLYRAEALQSVGGFDERYTRPSAEDAHLSFAVQSAGYRLRFESASRVGHYHPQHLGRYLRTQAHHGYWRVLLHMEHRGHSAGDSYSSWLDHIQPMLAMATLAALALPIASIFFPETFPASLAAVGLLLLLIIIAATLPMTCRLLLRTGRVSMLLYTPLSTIRAFWRGIGLTFGVLHYALLRKNRSVQPSNSE